MLLESQLPQHTLSYEVSAEHSTLQLGTLCILTSASNNQNISQTSIQRSPVFKYSPLTSGPKITVGFYKLSHTNEKSYQVSNFI